MESIAITRVETKDAERLRQISTATFLEAFAEGNTEENMTRYLAENFSVAKLLN